MPNPKRPPRYRFHKPRGCGVVTNEGHNHYLGLYGSPESYEEYARLLAEWKANPSRPVGRNAQGRRRRYRGRIAGRLSGLRRRVLRQACQPSGHLKSVHSRTNGAPFTNCEHDLLMFPMFPFRLGATFSGA